MDEKNVNTNNSSGQQERTAPAPQQGDLDDLIFRGQGWLISDR